MNFRRTILSFGAIGFIALAALSLFFAQTTHAEDPAVPSFLAPINYDGGTDAATLAVGDFNGDQIRDLIAVNTAVLGGTPSLSVFLGNGDGTFQPAVFTPIAASSDMLAVADFDGDGLSDVVARTPDGNLSVFLSNGDGTFQAPLAIPGSDQASAVAAADLNGDGFPDLIVGRLTQVRVYLNNGDGTFASPANYSAPVGLVRDVTIGDFNGDGIADILALDFSVRSGGFDVFLGNGDGTFQDPIRTPEQIMPLPRGLAAVDLDHDQKADLVFARSNDIVVRLGNGDGTFQPATVYNTGDRLGVPTVIDINGDGHPDLVTPALQLITPAPYPGVLKVFLGNGDGTFRPGQDIECGGDLSNAVVFGDWNGDGVPDVAWVLSVNHGVAVRLGSTAGTFQLTPRYASGQRPWGVAAGDFDGDGIADLAVANNIQSGGVRLLLGNGDGTFRAGGSFATGPSPTEIVAGDFNNDNQLDLIVSDGQGVRLYLGNGDGTFLPPSTISPTPAELAVADFNNDGKLDLVLSDDHGVKLLLGNGDGSFRPPSLILSGFGSVAIGDFNGDHQPDVAVLLRDAGLVSVLLGNGDGTFQAAQSYAVGGRLNNLAAGDLNGDGRDDLVVSSDGESYFVPGSVSVLVSNADGTFRPAVPYLIGPNPGALLVADFNGAGRRDVAVLEGSSASSAAMVRLLWGNGDGTLLVDRFTYSLASSISNKLVLGDFNGDGLPDIVASNTNDNTVSILLSASGPSQSSKKP
jgi:hypothetical protein